MTIFFFACTGTASVCACRGVFMCLVPNVHSLCCAHSCRPCNTTGYLLYVCGIHASVHLPSSGSSYLASLLGYYLLPWLQGCPGFCAPGPTPPADPQCSGEHTPGQGHAHHHQVQAEKPDFIHKQLRLSPLKTKAATIFLNCDLFFIYHLHLETRKPPVMSSSSTPRD